MTIRVLIPILTCLLVMLTFGVVVLGVTDRARAEKFWSAAFKSLWSAQEDANTQRADDLLARDGRLAQEGEDAGGGVVAIHPLEAGGIKVRFKQRRLTSIERVQIANPPQQSAVEGRM